MGFLYNNPDAKVRRRALRNDMPKSEKILWQYLKGKALYGYKFRRQYGVGMYILDFYCPKLRLALEIDGDSHFSSEAEAYDKSREQFLSKQNITVLRFTNLEIINNKEYVITKLLEYLP